MGLFIFETHYSNYSHHNILVNMIQTGKHYNSSWDDTELSGSHHSTQKIWAARNQVRMKIYYKVI